MKPHKHAELIKAWADGAEIQLKGKWGWHDAVPPRWEEDTEYRIKPKEPVVRWLWAYHHKYQDTWLVCSRYMTPEEASDQFSSRLDPYKKLEWSREEFDE